MNPYRLYLYCLLLATIDVAASSAVALPEAFPEGRMPPSRVTTENPRPPIALPPGASPPARPSLSVTPPASDSADWLLKRLAGANNPALRARAAEVWPVSDETIQDLNTLVYALADSDSRVREGAVLRLQTLEPAEVFGFVMRTMVGGSVDRVQALDTALPALAGILDYYMMETLRTELETNHHRRIAAYCLGRMGAESAHELLAASAWTDDEALARSCVEALAALALPAAQGDWLRLLDHEDPYIRMQAVHALAAIGSPGAFEQLRQIILGNGDASLQQAALTALSDYPAPLLFPLLVEILETNAPTRAQALRLLRGRTGLELGARAADWRDWVASFLAGPPPPPLMPAP